MDSYFDDMISEGSGPALIPVLKETFSDKLRQINSGLMVGLKYAARKRNPDIASSDAMIKFDELKEEYKYHMR